MEEIRNILKNNHFYKLNDNIFESKNIKDAEYKLCEVGDKIKRRKKVKLDNKELYNIEYNKKPIIKKIKEKLLLYALKFLNNILKNSKIKRRLYILDFKHLNQLKKEKDMNILKMSLKELYSLDINPTFKKLSKDYNKTNIKKIIDNKNNKIKDYPTIIFVFNLSFGDWMDLFCYKKNIDEILKKYEGIYNINKETIINNIIGVEDLLNKILEENDEDYFSIFTFFLYNYKRLFYIIKNKNNV